MDYDNTLFSIVCFSSLASLAIALKRFRPIRPGWIVLCAAAALLSFCGWVGKQPAILYVATALWFFLILLPGLIGRLYLRCFMRQEYQAARRLAEIIRWLHPLGGTRELPKLIGALELAQRGDLTAATETLKQVHEVKSAIGVVALVSLYRLTNQWDELLVWTEQYRQEIEANPQLLPTALAHEERRATFGAWLSTTIVIDSNLQSSLLQPLGTCAGSCCLRFAADGTRSKGFLPAALRFCQPRSGRIGWPRPIWRLVTRTRQCASCKTCCPRQTLCCAAPSNTASLRFRFHDSPWMPKPSAVIEEVVREHGDEERFAVRRPLFSGRSRATQALIVLNLLMFLVEICVGDSTDWRILYRLGAFYTPAVQDGQWWRIITPLFLHCGALHLTMNVLGLWILGPYVEFALGFWRFLLVYLVAGIGSSVMVFLLSLGANEPTLMVGASGCVMGLVGATGALMLRGWLREKAIVAKRRLVAVLLIVAMQTVSDYIVPHVSMTAHLSGAIIGFAATIVLWAIPGGNSGNSENYPTRSGAV